MLLLRISIYGVVKSEMFGMIEGTQLTAHQYTFDLVSINRGVQGMLVLPCGMVSLRRLFYGSWR